MSRFICFISNKLETTFVSHQGRKKMLQSNHNISAVDNLTQKTNKPHRLNIEGASFTRPGEMLVITVDN